MLKGLLAYEFARTNFDYFLHLFGSLCFYGDFDFVFIWVEGIWGLDFAGCLKDWGKRVSLFEMRFYTDCSFNQYKLFTPVFKPVYNLKTFYLLLLY